jgi:ferritin
MIRRAGLIFDVYILGLMQMPDKLAEKFNDQITLELASAIAYLQLAAYFDAADLRGMASWMRSQSAEERNHAERLMTHLVDRGGKVSLGTIPAPQSGITSPLHAFQMALEHEQKVSDSIREIYRLANDLGDIDSVPLLQWFVAEQVEEEASVSEIISQLERVGGEGSALLILDQELGKRQPPASD